MKCKREGCGYSIKERDLCMIVGTTQRGNFQIEIAATCPECGAEYTTDIISEHLELIE